VSPFTVRSQLALNSWQAKCVCFDSRHDAEPRFQTNGEQTIVVDEGWCCTPFRSSTDIVRSPSDSCTNSGESVYHRQWNIPTNQSKAPAFTTPGTVVQQTHPESHRQVAATNKHEDDAKLLFGVVYSLRNMTRRLSSPYFHLPTQFRSRLMIEMTSLFLIELPSISYITTRRRHC
jgi:hypothetical protein